MHLFLVPFIYFLLDHPSDPTMHYFLPINRDNRFIEKQDKIQLKKLITDITWCQDENHPQTGSIKSVAPYFSGKVANYSSSSRVGLAKFSA